MYSNVFKYNQVIIKNDDALVIDNNEKVARKIEYLEELIQKEAREETFSDNPEGFTTGLDAQQVDALTMDEEEQAVIKAEAPVEQAEASASLEVISAQAQEMLAEARREAERIKSSALSEAQREIEELRQTILEESRTQGYETGYNEGMTQVESQRKNLEEERERLEKEYYDMVNELEPKFVETLTDIYEKVLKVDLSRDHNILVHLISSAMHKIEGSSNYLIHVSREDYQYVNLKKEEALVSAVSPHSSVEIVEDMTLGANDCIIETDGGVFDCGLGTQLEELSQKLRLLSYTRAQ